MLKQQAKLFQIILVIADNAVIMVSYLAAVLLRNRLSDVFDNPFAGTMAGYAALLIVIIPVWTALIFWFGLYASQRQELFQSEVWAIVKVVVTGIILLNSFIFLMKVEDVSRAVIGSFGLVAIPLLTLERFSIRAVMRALRTRGYNFRNLLIAGTGPRACDFVAMIRRYPEWALRVHGYLDRDPSAVGQSIGGIPVVGTISDISHVLDQKVIDQVVFIMPLDGLKDVEKALLACEEVGVEASVSVDAFALESARPHLMDVHGFSLLTYSRLPSQMIQLFAKQVFDFAAAGLLLLILLPLLLLVAIAIRLTSEGQAIFRQVRVGMNGRRFTLYKFRTMVKDAETQIDGLRPMNESDGPVFKIRKDPRVTRVGRILRRTSMDELPQLVNVLKGEMSLVGPRPPLPSEVQKYKRWQRRRLSMKPGITGLWQISGRSDLGFDEWVNLDLAYIDQWSFGRDIAIILKTVVAVLRGRGAY